MVTEAEAFCLSCGVARNNGHNCDYCGRRYVSATKANTKPAPHRSLASKYKVKKKGGETVISWRWRKRSAWIMIPFALYWISVSLSFDGENLLRDPVPMIPVLIGIAILIYAIIHLINQTTIHVSRQSLSIRHHPIAWRRNTRYSRNEIKQLFISKVQRSNKHRSWQAPVLQLVTHSNVRQAILSGYNESQFADFQALKHEIQEALGLEDTPTTID